MSGLFLFAISVIYSPGPVNLLALYTGIRGRYYHGLCFALGVGGAMLLLFLLTGYTGASIIPDSVRVLIARAGALYLLYLSVRLLLDTGSSGSSEETGVRTVSFHSGLIMQLFNPKALIVIIPVTTVQFPALHITGSSIAVWSLLLALLAAGAPLLYCSLGYRFSSLMQQPGLLRWMNRATACMLVLVAVTFFSY